MSNLIGYHFTDQIYSDAQVAKHMEHLRAAKPSWINVLGGAQYKEALAFAKLVRRDIPETRVIFRHFKDGSDNGMHTRLTADEWWTKIGSLYVGSDLTILTDNESGSEDLTYYSDWHARAMTLASQHGVSLAVARFSTHNPPSKQWSQLDSLWRALGAFHSLHLYSPNIYFSDTNFDGIEHIFEAWRRCADLDIPAPNTVIGEFAYCQNLDPHRGYRSVKMSGVDYVTRLIQRGAPLWGAGIPACIYSIGEWPIGADSFSLDEDALKALRARVVTPPSPPIPVPPPTPPPPPAPAYPPLPLLTDKAWSWALASSKGVNVRRQPAVISQPESNVIKMFEGERVRVQRTGPLYGNIPNEWCGFSWGAVKGWVNTAHVQFEIAPPVVVPPLPDTPALGNWKLEFILTGVDEAFVSKLQSALTIVVTPIAGEPVVKVVEFKATG